MVSRKARIDSGFTLIEIVLAISILVVLMTVSYGALNGIIRTKQMLDDRRESRLIANSVLSRFTRELQLAVADVSIMPPRETPNETPPRRLSLEGEEDSIRFVAQEGGQYLPDGGTHSGLVQIAYVVRDDPERKEIGEEKTYYLVREETPYTRPFDKAYEKIMIFPITTNLISLKFRYYDLDEDQWYSDWGTGDRMRLPQMIRFTVELLSPKGEIETFTTAVPLRNKA